MVMEPVSPDYTDYIDDSLLDDEPLDLSFWDIPSPTSNHHPSSFNSFPNPASQLDSPDDLTDCVSTFLNNILVEENGQSKESMFPDPLDLQATEKSFYEALGQTYPPQQPLSINFPQNTESPEEITYGYPSEYSPHSSTSGSNSINYQFRHNDSFDTKSSLTQTHPLEVNDTMDSMLNTHMVVKNIFTNKDSISMFKKGMEEASKFLPTMKPFVIDIDKYNLPKDSPPEVIVKVENVDISKSGFKARKHDHLVDNNYDEDERSSKQSAVYQDEEAELSEMFEKILLCTNEKGEPMVNSGELSNNSTNNLPHAYTGWNAPLWRPLNTNDHIDIRKLLINCADSVSADEYKIASEQLKQIRKYSSPSGNYSQRLAHIFALGLEARLRGTGLEFYTSQKAMRISAAAKLRAFQDVMTACPFKKNELYFANRNIYEASLTSPTLHVVDFGIAYGFQWPILVKHLATRPGGPPKLRITGIELPQPGFRPSERVEETGRRLATYCERFKVPFEYNAIAVQDWEKINIEDLKLQRNEFLAVNALGRFENLLDETIMNNNDNSYSPRDGVLKVIRDMKPDIFVHSIVNGSYGTSYFGTRFKEALLHYSALFDMLDAILERENEQRKDFEKEFYGREVMNVVACEGCERVERPETYKQWNVRNSRAGFKPKRVDREVFSQLKNKMKAGHHKDFLFDEDGKWILQGWKGRILNAISCWVPA